MLRRCTIRNGRDSALAVLGHSRVTVEECPIDANNGTGIYADDGSIVVVGRCDIRGSGESGLYLNHDSQATVDVLDWDLSGNANGPWKAPWFGGGRRP